MFLVLDTVLLTLMQESGVLFWGRPISRKQTPKISNVYRLCYL